MKDFYDDRFPEEEEPAVPSEPDREPEQETTEPVAEESRRAAEPAEEVPAESEPTAECTDEAPAEDVPAEAAEMPETPAAESGNAKYPDWPYPLAEGEEPDPLDVFWRPLPGQEAPKEAPPEDPRESSSEELPTEPAAPQTPPAEPVPPVYGQPTNVPPQYPYSYPGYQQPVQQPYSYQAPYAQPVPPQGQQPQPQQYPYPYRQPYGYYSYPAPQKKKMSTGTKVFIWVASVLAGLAILSFLFYVGYAFGHRTDFDRNGGYWDYYEEFREHNMIPDRDPDRPSYRDELPDDDEEDLPFFDEEPEPDTRGPDLDIEIVPNTEGITIEEKPSGAPMTAAEVYAQVVKSTVTVELTAYDETTDTRSVLGTGTGIAATEDGYIITNSHVVNDSKASVVYITTYDGFKYRAVVVGLDRTSDLAILKVSDKGYDFIPAHFGDSDALVIGDQVIAIGNPGGATYFGSMTGGYISGLGRSGKYSSSNMTYIQTDAAVNPGNSGGPLVNMYGQVVGINTAKIIADGYEGMGFAIPISNAQGVINQLLAGGYVEGRVRMGIRGSEMDSQIAEYYGVPRGFVIASIDEISGFSGTDAMPGDIITAIDGETVQSLADISNQLLKHVPGDTITVTLYRPTDEGYGGETFDVEVLLLEDKGETQE